jgi:hypothetical protein
MNKIESRDRVMQEFADAKIIETTRALIKLYRDSFGDEWIGVYQSTVNIHPFE